MFLHETGPSIHTHYDELARLPAHVRSRARLIHYPDDLDPAAPREVEALVQGRRYDVP